MTDIRKNTFSIISLGCPKNLVDSEHCVFQMQSEGGEFQTEIDGCETVVLNTCGFLKSARNEAREYLDALLELKLEHRIAKIIVRGCMPQFEGLDRLIKEYPQVDQWFGVPGRETEDTDSTAPSETDTVPGRRILTEPHVAYLRIADGCSRHCTFCAIPKIRGPFRSVPMDPLLREAKRLAASGIKELVVIAQETTFWGMDLEGRPRLVELLRQLEKIEGIRWIRLMYAYPKHFDDELIELFAAKGKLLPYIDLPLQHADDEILQRMNRRVTLAETETLLGRLRDRIEGLVLRTSLIVGFPGETDEMFENLLHFVRKWKFERAGVFPFSSEFGTEAATFKERVPVKTVQRRFDRLYKTCERFSTERATGMKGTLIDVQIDGNFVDESGAREPNLFIGRTYADAPDIDPVVYVTGRDLQGGQIVSCEILETEGCDLVGIAMTV